MANILEYNSETNEVLIREFTAEEEAQREIDIATPAIVEPTEADYLIDLDYRVSLIELGL